MSREAFDQFWHAYPKRPNNPKQPAWEEWQRLAKAGVLPSPAEMVDAAHRYGAYIRSERIEAKFVAHARTWLHQRRYEEYHVIVSQNDACGKSANDEQKPSVPAIMAPVFKALGDERYLSQFSTCQFEEEGDLLVIRPRYRFMVDRIQEGLVSRLTGRRVKVEVAA